MLARVIKCTRGDFTNAFGHLRNRSAWYCEKLYLLLSDIKCGTYLVESWFTHSVLWIRYFTIIVSCINHWIIFVLHWVCSCFYVAEHSSQCYALASLKCLNTLVNPHNIHFMPWANIHVNVVIKYVWTKTIFPNSYFF